MGQMYIACTGLPIPRKRYFKEIFEPLEGMEKYILAA
jgi:hypothetical protein